MDGIIQYPLEATHIKGRIWAVRPQGRVGTCGFYPCAWTVQYVKARSAEEAVAKAKPLLLVDKAAA